MNVFRSASDVSVDCELSVKLWHLLCVFPGILAIYIRNQPVRDKAILHYSVIKLQSRQ